MVPARKPATIDIFGESPHFLRQRQITALNIDEKLARNIPNAALSRQKSTPNRVLGLLMIFFKPKTRDTPALMR